jgi:tRNA pseudouridine38-40 synthase
MQESTHNLLLRISYLGTRYAGSQIQKNSITIQELLDTAVRKIFNQSDLRSVFSGRTDTGVHASDQPVHVVVSNTLPITNVRNGLNALLPSDIRVVSATYEKKHARYDARSREYIYLIYHGDHLPLYLKNIAWFIPAHQSLNTRAMQKACRVFHGCHDFSSVCAAGSSVDSKVRTVTRSSLTRKKVTRWPGDKRTESGVLLVYQIRANGFLYHMVRNIVGAIVAVGKGDLSVSELHTALKNKNRKHLRSSTAPAHGLVLNNVEY